MRKLLGLVVGPEVGVGTEIEDFGGVDGAIAGGGAVRAVEIEFVGEDWTVDSEFGGAIFGGEISGVYDGFAIVVIADR